jgi:high-affinity nickel-transport protein
MTLAVASVSLLVAGLGAARLASTRFEGWADGKELAIGLGVIALIALSYALAVWRAGTARAPSARC